MLRRTAVVFAIAAFAAAAVGAAPASAAPAWAPADTATVHPGVQTFTEGGQCTANFIFFRASDIYIGQSAHCSSTGAANETNGCDAQSHPVGTAVEVTGASRPGTMVYNSWITMQERGEADDNTCQYNDFALVKLDPADHGNVNPSIPFWGGPTGIATTTANGDKVLSYGNSSLRLGVNELSPKEGMSLGAEADGWTHPVYTFTPGIPGDSGSAFIDRTGMAFGTLSTLAVAPLPASNGVGDLSRELIYMRTNSSLAGVEMANGTEPFSGPRLP